MAWIIFGTGKSQINQMLLKCAKNFFKNILNLRNHEVQCYFASSQKIKINQLKKGYIIFTKKIIQIKCDLKSKERWSLHEENDVFCGFFQISNFFEGCSMKNIIFRKNKRGNPTWPRNKRLLNSGFELVLLFCHDLGVPKFLNLRPATSSKFSF